MSRQVVREDEISISVLYYSVDMVVIRGQGSRYREVYNVR